MEKYKEKLIKRLKLHIDFVREKVAEKLKITKVLANRSLKELNRMPPEEQMVYMDLKAKAENRVLELTHLDGSPYFMKCEIVNEKGEEKEYYFSKHELYEQSIYSWVAPIAAIRFENPGQVS